MNTEQRLKTLRRTADEALGGLNAAPGGAYRAFQAAQAKHSVRSAMWLKAGVPALAAALVIAVVLWGVPGLIKAPAPTPAVQSIAAGEGPAGTAAPLRADLPSGSVTLNSGRGVSFRSLFAGSSVSSFPMVLVDGEYYRMLTSPESLNKKYLGKALGKVTVYASSPSGSGISSNTVLEGETVYAVKNMDGAAVAARVNGQNRVFQRVSLNGQGLEYDMGRLVGSAEITEISLSGVGRVTEKTTIQRLRRMLINDSSFLSGSCTATSQGLYLTLENGVTLQMYVSGGSVMSCGVWSCDEFLDEFRQAAR